MRVISFIPSPSSGAIHLGPFRLRAYGAGSRAVCRRRPWLVVLDDVQWSDAGTVRLLTHVGPAVRSIGALLDGQVTELSGHCQELLAVAAVVGGDVFTAQGD